MSFVQKIEHVNLECIVAATFKTLDITSTMVAIYKPGNKQYWNIVYEDNNNFRFIDFLFNNNSSAELRVIGRAEQFEAHNILESVAAVGCDEVNLIIPCLQKDDGWREWSMCISKPYVEEPLISNEILLIKRNYGLSFYQTESFDVFKMDCKSGEWRRVYNIGDQVIFIWVNSKNCPQTIRIYHIGP